MTGARYIVVEGPIGVGKAALAEKTARALGARVILEEAEDNPFLPDFFKNRERYAFQTQLYFLLSRYRQLQEAAQPSLFEQTTVGDCLFSRDRIFAALNLDEAEFALYDQVFALLAERVPQPDLVVYLSARTEVLVRRLRESGEEQSGLTPDYLRDLNEAYNHFFFHYDQSPLLVVNCSDVDFIHDDAHFEHLLREMHRRQKGVKHYIPLGAESAGGI